MASIDAERMLRCAPDLSVRLRGDGDISLAVQGREVVGGGHTLAILDAFRYPCSIAHASKLIGARYSGAQAWSDLATSIVHLHEAGVLVDASGEPRLGSRGYASAEAHIAMLNDRPRTAKFLAGVREVVRPGDVVVDLGTGTGILAIAAAQAGARHVYAIEANPIGETAQAMFEANGVADRITLVRGWSTQVELPERADVLVSEMIGNDPLDESVLELTLDARKRFLKPNARFVPDRIRLFALPLSVEEREIEQHLFRARMLHDWNEWYGIDFARLLEIGQASPKLFFLRPQVARVHDRLGGPILLDDIDLARVEHTQRELRREGTVDSAGTLNALLVYFEAGLGPRTLLSTSPDEADDSNHWFSPVWVLHQPREVRAGERFTVCYRRGVSRADSVEIEAH